MGTLMVVVAASAADPRDGPGRGRRPCDVDRSPGPSLPRPSIHAASRAVARAPVAAAMEGIGGRPPGRRRPARMARCVRPRRPQRSDVARRVARRGHDRDVAGVARPARALPRSARRRRRTRHRARRARRTVLGDGDIAASAAPGGIGGRTVGAGPRRGGDHAARTRCPRARAARAFGIGSGIRDGDGTCPDGVRGHGVAHRPACGLVLRLSARSSCVSWSASLSRPPAHGGWSASFGASGDQAAELDQARGSSAGPRPLATRCFGTRRRARPRCWLPGWRLWPRSSTRCWVWPWRCHQACCSSFGHEAHVVTTRDRSWRRCPM